MAEHMFEKKAPVASTRVAVHVFLLREDRVLLTRRGPGAPYAAGSWHAGVAGKVDPGEDVVSATVRESGEELGVGVDPADLEFAHVLHSGEGGQDWVNFFFSCRNWSGTPVNNEPHKHAEIGWWPVGRPPRDMVGYCARALEHTLAGVPFSLYGTAAAFPVPAVTDAHAGGHRPPAPSGR